MHPDILGQIDPSGRGQNGAAGKTRSKGRNRDFLSLGGWRRGGTACTSGSAVGFGRHFKNLHWEAEAIVAGPRIECGGVF
jgi:hypothetical protein